MVHLEISTWTWGKVCHFQNLSPVLEIHVHESSWTAFDHLTTFFRKNKVKKIEFRTHDLQTVGYAYISFCVTQLHINVLKDLFYCKRKYVTIYIAPLTSFVSSYINFFPKFTLFHFQKKKNKKNCQITVSKSPSFLKYLGLYYVFHYQCVVHIL